jgi:hypothetical protein
MTEPSKIDSTSPDPTSAGGAETLLDVLSDADAAGFPTQLMPNDDGTVRCDGCGEASPAGDFTTERVDRLEGASDPDDMMLVARTICPRCGRGGALVLGYGPTADAADVAVLGQLELDDASGPPV